MPATENWALQLLLQMKNQIGAPLSEASHEIEAFGAKFGVVDNAAAASMGKIGGMAGALGGLGGMGVLGPIALVATGIGAIGMAAHSAFEKVSELGNEARDVLNAAVKSGTDPAAMEALRKQAETLRIDPSAITMSMKFLQKAIAADSPLLKDLGVTAKDTYGAFLQLADGMSKYADGATKTQWALALLGSRGGQALLPLLDQGSAGIIAFREHIDQLGVGLDDLSINRLALFHARQEEVRLRLEGLSITVTLRLLPAIEHLTDALIQLLDKLEGVAKWHPPAWMSDAGGVVGRLAQLVVPGGREAADLFRGVSKAGGNASVGAYGPQRDPEADLYALLAGLTTPDANKPQMPAVPAKAKKSASAKPPGMAEWMNPRLQAYLDQINSDMGTTLTMEDIKDGPKRLKEMTKELKEQKVAQLQWIGSGAQYARLLDDQHKALGRVADVMQHGLADGINTAVSSVIEGTASIGDAFKQLIDGILQKLAEAAAQQGIGLGLEALGWAVGGPVGGVLGGVGGIMTGGNAARPAPAGDVHVHVNALSAKDVLRSMTSPSGEIRQASRQLAIAGRLP